MYLGDTRSVFEPFGADPSYSDAGTTDYVQLPETVIHGSAAAGSESPGWLAWVAVGILGLWAAFGRG